MLFQILFHPKEDCHHKPDLAGITEPGGQRMEENKVTVTARETKAAEGEMIQR